MPNFSVSFYETPDGRYPAEEFVKSQPVKMRAKIYRELELLEEFGNSLRMPYSEHLEEGIFQIRAQVGNDISRVLYFFFVDKQIILTNGFQYRSDYLERCEKNA